jgi:hypothetical protein
MPRFRTFSAETVIFKGLISEDQRVKVHETAEVTGTAKALVMKSSHT